MTTAYPSTPPPMGFAPGTVLLDKYRVERELGVGGMGFVVAAQHLGLDQRVAIKFLLPQFAVVAESAARFVREGRAATRIQGEHVARVLDVGQLQNGVPYLVMEYLDGKDLYRLLREGYVFAVPEAIDYVVQAAEALAEAHRSGIIHRDVKPANLFLTRRADDRPLIKVLDFGISKVLDEGPGELSLTKTTSVLGSGLYMSPEQMRSARNVDARTDVYALGVCLYELLTRTHPFTAESFSELCLKVNLEPPDPIRRHRPDIPEDLAEAIAKAYAKNPDERYGSMAAFARALAPWALPETRTLIDAIQRIARESLPDLGAARSSLAPGIVERNSAVPLVSRAKKRSAAGKVVGVAVALVAISAAATVVVVVRPWDRRGPTPAAETAAPPSAVTQAPSAAPPEPSVPASEAVEPPPAPVPSGAASAAVTASGGVSAAPVVKKPPTSPTKKPCDENKRYPNGLKIPCDLQ